MRNPDSTKKIDTPMSLTAAGVPRIPLRAGPTSDAAWCTTTSPAANALMPSRHPKCVPAVTGAVASGAWGAWSEASSAGPLGMPDEA